MDKVELQNKVAEVHAAWEDVLAELGAEGLERPGAAGEWRVRDVLAHFNGWDHWQLVQIRCAFSGETPTDDELAGGVDFPENNDFSEDAMNAMFYEGNKDRPLADVVADYRSNCRLRTEWIAAVTQEELETRYAMDWAGGNRVFRLAAEVPHLEAGERVWERFASQIAHHREHLDAVREWTAKG